MRGRMKTILDHLKESEVSLSLTETQSAELNRWLDEFEKDADARSSWRETWERIRKN
jgi:putative addiction module component (TIGR02574 family)